MSHAALSRPEIDGQALLGFIYALGLSLLGVFTGVIGLIAGIVMMLKTYSKGRKLLHYVLY